MANLKTKKQKYLEALGDQPTDWVVRSMQSPNGFMSNMHLLLHKVYLRRIGALPTQLH